MGSNNVFMKKTVSKYTSPNLRQPGSACDKKLDPIGSKINETGGQLDRKSRRKLIQNA